MVPIQVPPQPVELTPAHLERLHRLVAEGFEPVQFPYFAGYVGVRKHGCAALLRPLPGGELRIVTPPSYVVEGNLSALVERGGEQWFVWKSHQVRATEERLRVLKQFEEELRRLLATPAVV